ncbi:HAD-IA family hydrolase [Dactylosporangium sp. NPDC051485]|uniref:HAD-IA family hydrolase n=1 Tax=Dactylosporangium sp. NPDC051485 TaxID=3154846 RepID=UPI00344A5B80
MPDLILFDLFGVIARHQSPSAKHTDLVAFSCRIGRAKPDADAYLRCCHELGLAPDRVLFIDDRAENVHAAERLGLHTHLFTGPAETAQVVGATRSQPEPDGRRA